MTLQYSVIRFSPRPDRGELLNVGVVVVDPERQDARVSLVEDRHRFRVISNPGLVQSTFDYLSDWKTLVEDGEGAISMMPADEWLRQRSDASHNLIELSAPAPILVADLDEAVSFLSKKFLPAPRQIAKRDVTRRRAISALREAYAYHGLVRGVNFVEKPLIRSKNYSEVMDFAVRNGKAVQLAQTWNFKQRGIGTLLEGVKAWAWTVRDIRSTGATAKLEAESFSVPKDVDVEAVYIDPDTSEGADALAEALHAFRDVRAKAIRADHLAPTAQRAVRALEATSH